MSGLETFRALQILENVKFASGSSSMVLPDVLPSKINLFYLTSFVFSVDSLKIC